MKPVALFSLYNTEGSLLFAERLIALGWDIIASAETSSILREKGLPVQNITDFTGVYEDYGFPPTLHAKVEYALTGSGTPRIDLVYVIPYPLSVGIDIGGRTLLALAVKGKRIAVMDKDDMEEVVTMMADEGEISLDMRNRLADKVCCEAVVHYAALISSREKNDLIAGSFSYDLMNGENPYQTPSSAFISHNVEDPLSLMRFNKVTGNAPCFTNMADADSILTSICLSAEAYKENTGSIPYLCIAAKHGNACGFGFSRTSPAESIKKALFGNPRSIWGGEVITNFSIDKECATLLFKSELRKEMLNESSWMLDLIMAPSFSNDAISILGERRERKLFANEALFSPSLKGNAFDYRMVRGGFLRQPPASYVLNLKECTVNAPLLYEEDIDSLIIAWAAVYSSNLGGNEVALAKDGALLSIGGGPSTVEAARVAIMRAHECDHDTRGSAFAADAFFPFIDAPVELHNAGVALGCVPAGGKREQDVMDYFLKNGIMMAYIAAEFRGFCRH